MVQQLPALSLSKPLTESGKTIVQLRNTSSTKENDRHTPESVPKVRHDNLNLESDNDDSNSVGSPWQSTQLRDTESKKRGNEYAPVPGGKVRRLQRESHDNLTLELDSDDSVDTILWCPPLDDYGDGGGGSTHATQQVSQLGLPTETLSACAVAPSDKMCEDGTVGRVSSSQQVSKSSSDDQQMASSSSASGLVMTSSELGGTSSQYVDRLSSTFRAILPADNTGRNSSSNVLTTIPTPQQELVSVNASSSLELTEWIQLPTAEAHQITAVPPVMETESQLIYISSPIQNKTSIVSNQQTEDFESQHLYSRYDTKHIYL
jgi:hypothetical protein